MKAPCEVDTPGPRGSDTLPGRRKIPKYIGWVQSRRATEANVTGWGGAAGIREGLSEEAARRLKPEGSSGSGHTQIYWAACRTKALGQERAVSSRGGSQSMSWGTLGAPPRVRTLIKMTAFSFYTPPRRTQRSFPESMPA